MLKIKDEIDLKELEKFGFVYDENHFNYTCPNISALWIYGGCIRMLGNVNEKALDKLYDLITAGLVEKVEGEQDGQRR